jgi:hypothetical protein
VNNEARNERYLGMPTDVGTSRYGTFKFLRDRVWSKVKGWLEEILSVIGEGEEVLIKSVAQAIQYTQWHALDCKEAYVIISTH